MSWKCSVCFYRESGMCYNDKFAIIEEIPLNRKGEKLETAIIKCENYSNNIKNKRLLKLREEKLNRILKKIN